MLWDENEMLCGCLDETIEANTRIPEVCHTQQVAERRAKSTFGEVGNNRRGYDSGIDFHFLKRCFHGSKSTLEFQLRRDVMEKTAYLKQADRNSRVHALSRMLISMGYSVCVRQGHAFGSTTHAFLVVSDPRTDEARHALVDIDFRELFEIPRASTSYTQLLSLLPQTFIGSCKIYGHVSSAPPRCELLQRIAEIMSNAMQVSLSDSGLYMAPWRGLDKVLQRWCQSTIEEQESLSDKTDFWEDLSLFSPITPLVCRQ
ncbi:hypothetical protein CYMTET_42890 [Cymbomonas tetramitiformis]|uniref:Uncharacterized protein n=1 Tax=Cymbomonas tetramitiformis TaxID=36881 RepID=A0AAE0F126_9CHLO|nr:hypothetical protein CYMTET_42890 [Cymbomonas tetramitiformis]